MKTTLRNINVEFPRSLTDIELEDFYEWIKWKSLELFNAEFARSYNIETYYLIDITDDTKGVDIEVYWQADMHRTLK